MSQLIYLENSELYYVEGEIPEKPTNDYTRAKNNQVCLSFTGVSCTMSQPCGCFMLEAYTSAIASLKAKGVKVGNPEQARELVAIGCTPEHGKSATYVEGELYPIECEVEYKEQPCPCESAEHTTMCFRCSGRTKLASLSILSTEKKEPAYADLLKNSEGRNWQKDFKYENGNYICNCTKCNNYFLGHKRRPLCKLCWIDKVEDSQDVLWGEVTEEYSKGRLNIRAQNICKSNYIITRNTK